MRFEKIGRHTAKETSDRKPVGLPFELKELRTFACAIALSTKVGINYPHPPRGWDFSLRKGCVLHAFPFTSFSHTCLFTKCYSQNPPADWLCKSAPHPNL